MIDPSRPFEEQAESVLEAISVSKEMYEWVELNRDEIIKITEINI